MAGRHRWGGPHPYASQATSDILDRRWPEARYNLHQHLSYAVLAADWQEEFLAHQRFGDLYAATEQWTSAIRHYVSGNHRKKLKDLIRRPPDQPLDFHPPADDQPAWERAASFTFASNAAELIPEETAKERATASYRELTTREFSRSPNDTWIPAFEAFAGTCGAATLAESEGFWLHIAHALIALPVNALQIDLPVFGAHPNKAPRAFAARVWVRAPGQWPGLGVKLARDPEPAVRYALASSLDDSQEHDEVRQQLLNDHRRVIARAARQTIAGHDRSRGTDGSGGGADLEGAGGRDGANRRG